MRSEILRAEALTHDTNISIKESSADPSIERDPDANQIIALRIVSMREMTRAKWMPKEGLIGNLYIVKMMSIFPVV